MYNIFICYYHKDNNSLISFVVFISLGQVTFYLWPMNFQTTDHMASEN